MAERYLALYDKGRPSSKAEDEFKAPLLEAGYTLLPMRNTGRGIFSEGVVAIDKNYSKSVEDEDVSFYSQDLIISFKTVVTSGQIELELGRKFNLINPEHQKLALRVILFRVLAFQKQIIGKDLSETGQEMLDKNKEFFASWSKLGKEQKLEGIRNL